MLLICGWLKYCVAVYGLHGDRGRGNKGKGESYRADLEEEVRELNV